METLDILRYCEEFTWTSRHVTVHLTLDPGSGLAAFLGCPHGSGNLSRMSGA